MTPDKAKLTRVENNDAFQLDKIDTVRNDEALKVLAENVSAEAWDAAEEKRLVRKIDRKLLSLLCITYGLQYYDKSMLSQAAIFGLNGDLDLSVKNRYSFSASIFYLGFIAGACPTILLAQRYPIERVTSLIVTLWGVCLLSTIACHNYKGLYTQRFFLGFLEAGVSPMFMLVVGGWYRKNEQALRMGVWYCCTGYASAVAPLINYGIGHITTGPLHPWQYMYLIAGILTILWGIALYFILPPDPIRATGFTPRERYVAVARMRENNTGVRNTHFKWAQVRETAMDVRFWILFAYAFVAEFANAPFSSFTPIIIKDFGFSDFNSLLLSMPAGIVAGSLELGACYAALKIPQARTYIMVCCQALTILAACLLWKLPRDSKAGLLFGTYTLGGFGAAYAVAMGLQVANTAGYTKRAVSSAGLYVGFCFGNFVGPLLFKIEDAPTYGPGFVAVLGTAAVATVLPLAYRFISMWENKQRDKAGIVEGFDHAYEDDQTDVNNPQFRYTL